jgi:hypothetical protein
VKRLAHRLLSLERATTPEGASHARPPPPLSCHPQGLATRLSRRASRPGGAALAPLGRGGAGAWSAAPIRSVPKGPRRGPRAPSRRAASRGLARWGDNATVTAEVSCGPFAEGVLRHRAWPPWVMIMDGSVVGRGWLALRLHVVYKGRARPLGGPVRQGPQGPWPAAMPRALVEPLHALLPPGAQGVVLGAGAGAGPICASISISTRIPRISIACL